CRIRAAGCQLCREYEWAYSYYVSLADGPFLMRPKTVAQNLLKNLAGAALRQLGLRKLDAARNFEIGERSSAIRDQLISSEGFSRLKYNAGFHGFAPRWIRYSENRHFSHRCMRVDHSLHFAGVNVLFAGYDPVVE